MNTETLVKQGAVLGSLSGSAILGLMVIILMGVAWNLYKTLHKESQDKIKELINESKNTNSLIKEQIITTKSSSDAMLKFIETHCARTNDKLDIIDSKVTKLNENIIQVKNKELQGIYKRKEQNV